MSNSLTILYIILFGVFLFVVIYLKFTSNINSILEDEVNTLTYKGSAKKCNLEVSLKVHNPQFYWKVATRGDLGWADAYIDGDFSLVDKKYGLVTLFMLYVANRDLHNLVTKSKNKSGWRTPLLFSAGFASAKYYLNHVLRQNTLTQARKNISHHYDLSNELFCLFLDETMQYSCAIFKTEGEDLKVAQLRKVSRLIAKARISKEHHILEIGCGWGSLGIEAVKQTGCKYTGITLSVQQLIYAEAKVKEAGLEDHITYILCDYRTLPENSKFHRIISCEMIEHVGHEYMDEFFRCCDSVLEEDGLLVLQFTSIPDQRYEEVRKSSDFLKSYVFPGGIFPALSTITKAMTAGSSLCVEHLENIGIHYYQTLRCWRENFMKNQSQILKLGFDEKFIRTFEYFFDFYAAGIKTCTLGNYQIVFSRPGNVALFGNPYKGASSTCSGDGDI